MLARVANSLYWTGRYVERSEHICRYLKVQYFSTFEAPIIQQKEIILKSILHMIGAETPEAEEDIPIDEQEILVNVAFSLEDKNSILSNVQGARENARNVRNVISTELWEGINRYYLFVKDYSIDFYKTRGLYDFTTNVIQNCSIIRSQIDSTLLHDNIWAFVKLGIYIERAAQVIRVLSNKLFDIDALSHSGKDDPLSNFQWTVTLKILEAHDMYMRMHRGVTDQRKVLMFLLANPGLTRSITFSLDQTSKILEKLSQGIAQNSKLKFQSAKLANGFRFLEYEEINSDLQSFLVSSLEKIYGLHQLIEKEYFE